MQKLARAMGQHGLVRFLERMNDLCPTDHLKDLVVEEMGADRTAVIDGRRVTNFGSDSFLGLDRHPRVQQALIQGLRKWGTHNGCSRAFASVQANARAEDELAAWLGTEAVLIYPSVTLANLGALPGLVGRQDVLVVDEHAHNSIQEGARIARANGVRVLTFSHCDPGALDLTLGKAGAYRLAVVAVDGVYSMSGELPPLAELNQVALQNDAVLYVDDAHGTGILGPMGRGAVHEALGACANAFVVGSLSKAFSCAGGFIGCTAEMKRLLKMRSNTYIFGGPVPPPYLEAICTVCDILRSPEYGQIIGRLRQNTERFIRGANQLALPLLANRTPILSVLVGDEESTLRGGHALMRAGYYVQSIVYPAVPYHAGVLRIQINANHSAEQIDGLLEAFASLSDELHLDLARSA
jgi:7-keto-8-aminopelargonate synthetase-like enzyme